MADVDYLGAIRTDADALATAAEKAGVDAGVPSCPDWKVADLLEHIGTVHRWAAMNLSRKPGDPYLRSGQAGIEAPEDDSARAGWVREGAAHLVDALDGHSPDAECWTWAPPANNGFWRRRQAHETAMHRVDAQLAAGTAEPIDAALASDGIDEWLYLLPRMPWVPEPITGNGETVHFHCTDVDGEWLVRLAPSGLEVEREHAKGDVAARGTASDILCWMMGRGPVDLLEVFGDSALLDRWREAATF
jgi:uncharacterized protein (TIGR03083 family)